MGERVYDNIKLAPLTNKDKMHYRCIDKYFKNIPISQIEKMRKIIDDKSGISLRFLDWFVTKLSDYHNISYMLDGEHFYIYSSYKAQLKTFRKQTFDPFRRGAIKFYYKFDIIVDGHTVTKQFKTTISQLNFFKWLFRYKIIDYIEDNLTKLTQMFISFNNENKKQKNEKETKKQKPDSTQNSTHNKNNKNNKKDKKDKKEEESFVISFK